MGIDIDLIIPQISYISPTSPLLGHVNIGDILVFVNGMSTADLSHGVLTRILNGSGVVGNEGVVRGGSDSNKVGDNNTSDGEIRLIFLPGLYKRQLGINKETTSTVKSVVTEGDANKKERGKSTKEDLGAHDVTPSSSPQQIDSSSSSKDGPPVTVSPSSSSRLRRSLTTDGDGSSQQQQQNATTGPLATSSQSKTKHPELWISTCQTDHHDHDHQDEDIISMLSISDKVIDGRSRCCGIVTPVTADLSPATTSPEEDFEGRRHHHHPQELRRFDACCQTGVPSPLAHHAPMVEEP